MKYANFPRVFICFALFFGTFLSGFSFSETPEKENAGTGSIVITSNSVEMNNVLKIVTFTGDVNAKKDEFVIECDKMLVYYESMPSQQDKQGARFNKIVATGNVTIHRAEGEQATAEKATYHPQDDRMVLTGNPTVKRGDDLVKGDRITIFLKEERSVVEGSEEKKVSVTISPRHEQR